MSVSKPKVNSMLHIDTLTETTKRCGASLFTLLRNRRSLSKVLWLLIERKSAEDNTVRGTPSLQDSHKTHNSQSASAKRASVGKQMSGHIEIKTLIYVSNS